MSKPRTAKRIVKITLELDSETHEDLDALAKAEARSKRKEAARIVTNAVRDWRTRREAIGSIA